MKSLDQDVRPKHDKHVWRLTKLSLKVTQQPMGGANLNKFHNNFDLSVPPVDSCAVINKIKFLCILLDVFKMKEKTEEQRTSTAQATT